MIEDDRELAQRIAQDLARLNLPIQTIVARSRDSAFNTGPRVWDTPRGPHSCVPPAEASPLLPRYRCTVAPLSGFAACCGQRVHVALGVAASVPEAILE